MEFILRQTGQKTNMWSQMEAVQMERRSAGAVIKDKPTSSQSIPV